MDTDPEIFGKTFESEDERPITLDTPLRLPERFSGWTDPTIIAKAEVFGKQLISESFHVIGQDAYEKAEQLKNANTPQEQMAVINWLAVRLREITDGGKYRFDDEHGNDEHFYYPFRLSPKIIGTYPNHELPPTCLGTSVLATSFLRRAGMADILHADVAQDSKERAAKEALLFIDEFRTAITEKFGLVAPEAIQESIDRIYGQLVAKLTRSESHHAAVYTKLLDGTWAQLDSNYDATLQIKIKKTNETLTTQHNTLKDLAPVAPGLELSTYLPGYLSRGAITSEILDKQDPSTLTTLFLEAYGLLSNEDPESFAQKVYDEAIKPFFKASGEDDRLKSMHRLFRSETLINDEGREKSTLKTFYKLFDKYVLWGEDVQKVLARCRTDSQYHMNRSYDVALLPFLMMASIASAKVQPSVSERAHAFVEVGLPESRIGMAVLSDFAAYVDTPLTSSFWLSHWPGSVSVMTGINGASHSSYEDSLVRNNIIYHYNHPLTSERNYGIIQSFLDLRRTREETDGNRQE
jgi:hypothetical protein